MTDHLGIQSYNNPERAQAYNTKTGFDPQRKENMLNVTRDVLIDLLPSGATLLELGAGSGLFTKQLLDTKHFKRIFITDGAKGMLDIAKSNLSSGDTQLIYEKLNFTLPQWSKSYEKNTVDAVTSSMALHHAEDKQTLFNEIYHVLAAGGIFVFADHISGTSPLIDRIIGRKRAQIKLNIQSTEKHRIQDIENFIKVDNEKQAAEGNQCESVSNYLKHLENSGFEDVDCIWRDYWLAVFIARKPHAGD